MFKMPQGFHDSDLNYESGDSFHPVGNAEQVVNIEGIPLVNEIRTKGEQQP